MNEFLILAAFLLAVYLLPTIIAIRRRHAKSAEIILLNITLGWTLLGWLFCLVKVLREDGGGRAQESRLEEPAEHRKQEVNEEHLTTDIPRLTGLKSHLVDSVKMSPKIIVSPAVFYANMPKRGGLLEPLIFAVAMGVIAGLASLMMIVMTGGDAVQIIAQSARMLILGPAVSVLLCFSGAATLFMVWYILGSKEPFETSFRCWAYLFSIFPILVLIRISPVSTFLARSALVCFYLIVASERVHHISPRKARTVFGSIVIMNTLFYVLLTKVKMFAD